MIWSGNKKAILFALCVAAVVGSTCLAEETDGHDKGANRNKRCNSPSSIKIN